MRKKVGRGAKKEGLKLAWYCFFFLSLPMKKEFSKNYTYI